MELHFHCENKCQEKISPLALCLVVGKIWETKLKISMLNSHSLGA